MSMSRWLGSWWSAPGSRGSGRPSPSVGPATRSRCVERDATPLPADPDAAFWWDRRGAPQVRHSHAFLARLRNLLRDRHPDVLAALLDAGATELRFAEGMPDTIDGPEPAAPATRTSGAGLPAHDLRVGAAQGVLASPGSSLLDGVGRRRPRRHRRRRPASAASPACTWPTAATIDADLVGARQRPPRRRPALVRGRRRRRSTRTTRTPASCYWSRFYRLDRARRRSARARSAATSAT